MGLSLDEGLIDCGTQHKPAVLSLPERSYVLPPSRFTKTICLGMGDEDKIMRRERIDGVPIPGHTLKHCGLPLPECRSGWKGAEILGPVARLGYVCRKCACNLHNSLCNRHLSRPPNYTGQDYLITFKEALDWYVEDLVELKIRYDSIYPEIRKNWWGKWTLAKQTMIRRSLRLDLEYQPDRVSAFIKREVNPTMPSKARSIQGYKNLSAQYLTARQVTAAQKAFARKYDVHHQRGDIGVTFASGLDSATLGDWMSGVLNWSAKPMFYERDGKNWDATMMEAHFQVKFFIENAMISDFQAREALAKGAHVRCRVRFGHEEVWIKYTSDFTVKSGHNDTSLGNSIINAAIAITAAVRLGYRVKIIVMGDDLLMAEADGRLNGEEMAAIERSCGITPEYRVFDNHLDVSFISQLFYPTGRADHMFFAGPKPGRLLAKLFYGIRPVREADRKAWVHSVVMGLWAVCKHIPVLRAFLARADELAATDRIIPTQKYDKYFRCEIQADRSAVMQSFCARYHISESEVLELENYLLNIPTLCCFLSHPTIDLIIAQDLADPMDRRLASAH